MSKGLEALKYLKENKRKHWLDNDKSSESLDVIEKELRALEIIKRCGTDIALLKASRGKREYDQRLCRRVNDGIDSDQNLIYITESQEEYDLLKEVLL